MSFSGSHYKFKRGLLIVAAAALFVLSGCLGSGGSLTNLPTDESALVKMKIRLGRVDSRTDADPNVSLSKGSSIQVQSLRVTFISNLEDTVRDTVFALNGGLKVKNFLSDSVAINVSLRALRWWNVEIETRDQNDSIVHKGTAGPFASKGGQTMDITVPELDSRYLMYEAHYKLPPEIFPNLDTLTTDTVKQKIYFYRLVLEIAGAKVGDSSSFSPAVTAPGTRFIYADTSKLKGAQGKLFFKPNRGGTDTATHVQAYEYVKAGSHKFKMSAYGYLEGDNFSSATPRLLFQGEADIKINQTGAPSEEEVKLDYKGPGSEAAKDDSTYVPGGHNWNGVSMTVTLGRVKGGKLTVGVISTVDGF
jgi:hypothetical protein